MITLVENYCFIMASKPLPTLPPRPPKPRFLSAQFDSKLLPSSANSFCPSEGSQSEPVYQELGSNGPALNLSEIVEQHSQNLPMMVEVGGSLYGVGVSSSLLEGELLNFHFLKKTECARIMVERRKTRELSIPINSVLQFSPLYDPTDNINEARQGTIFKSVRKLMLTKLLPHVVCVTDVPGSEKIHSLVAPGDVLVLKNIVRKRAGGGFLICIHIQRNREIKLKEVWNIWFSSKPELLKLHLPELLDHVALPLKTIVGTQDKAQWGELQLAFPNHVCTVMSRIVEVSMIATYSQKGTKHSIMEIPANFSLLSVQIVQISSAVRQKLNKETAELYETFVQGMVDTWISDDVSTNYSLLLRKHVRESMLTSGITLIEPGGIAESVDHEYDYIKFNPKAKGQTNPSASAEISKLPVLMWVYIRTTVCHVYSIS